jgi:hypothetical protein
MARQQADLASVLLFLKNEESRPKIGTEYIWSMRKIDESQQN